MLLLTAQIVATQLRGISVDGRADPEWRKAPTYSNFLLLGTRKPAPQRTEAKIGFDGRRLLFLVRCLDTRIFSRRRRHDGRVWEDDSIEIFLAPSPSWYAHFIVNASGSTYEAMGMDSRWNCSWTASTSRFAGG